MKRNVLFFFIGFFLLVASASFGQCGDSCVTATPLTVAANGPCNYVTCTNISATPSAITGMPCSSINSSDVWYTFTVPAGVTTLIGQVLGGGPGDMTNPCIYFYRGPCSVLNSLGCNTGNPPSSLASLRYSSFVPGEQIWVRVKPSGGTSDGSFQICVYNPCPTGLSDDPCNALIIPISASCSSFVTLNNLCATPSAGIPAPVCGSYLGGDVWVQTTVGSNGHLEVNFEQQTLTNVACAAYTGSCNAPVLVACNDDNGSGYLPYLYLTGLTPNSTVWIRVWSILNAQAGTTGICLSDPCPAGNPPLNDDPCGATVIPIASTCGNFVTLSNVCATGSSGIPDPPCGGYQSSDVWVQTNVGASGYLFVNFQEQTLQNPAAAMYTGNCHALTYIACNDNGNSLMPQFNITSLTPGTPVWIRIWDNDGGDTGTVGICVYDPCITGSVMPPLYDNPPCPMPDSGSWYVPIVNGECITYTRYNSYCSSMVWGTTPAGIPPPVNCSGPFYPPGAATGWDVWAPFIIPDTPVTGYIDMKTRNVSVGDLDMAVYQITSPVDSNCANGAMYTLITCDDLGGPGFMPFIRLPFGGINAVQAGDTILLRMWNNSGGPMGEWEMCINYGCGAGTIPLPGYDEPPCPSTAVLLPVTNGPCNNFQQGNNFCAADTAAAGSLGCPGFGNTADVWYVVQMPQTSSGTLEINMQPGISTFDPGISVYTGTPVACGGTGLTLLACDDDGGIGLLPYIALTNPVNPGEFFYIRVWSTGGNESSFGLCVSDLCPGGNVAPPSFDAPPCPMPDSSAYYLPLSSGSCPDFKLYASNCASGIFGTSPAGVPVPSGCSGPSYPPGAATGWDVWTPFIVPDTLVAGAIDFRTNPYSAPDLDMALYQITPPISSNCSNGAMYTLIDCDDNSGPGSMPYLHMEYGGGNVVQPGDTLLVRTWRHSGGAWAQWWMSAALSKLPPAELCIVTVDSVTGKNLIAWEKTSTANVDSFCVYRETTIPGSFEKIGSVRANATSRYTDMTSAPMQHASRYRLTIKDSCGYESIPGLPHQTIYLSANADTSGGMNLAWNLYEGFAYSQQYILHGMAMNNLSVIDSVPGNQTSYTDTNPLPGVNYYAVDVRKSPVCISTPGGSSYGVSRSNIASEFVVGLQENLPAVSQLSVYPNPVLHSTVIAFSLVRPGAVRISVLDIAGREVSLLLNANLTSGQQRVEWNVSDQSYHPAAGGVYLIRVQSGNFSETRRVIVMPH